MPDERREDRRESPAARLDRNWIELLQELRITQTGTQIISGFLLTLAFQQRFRDLDTYQIVVYVVLVALAACSTVLGLAPVALHRALFRHHEKSQIVRAADRLLKATVTSVASLTAGVVLFIFDVVVGRAAGLIAGTATLALLAILLVLVPRQVERSGR